MKKLLFILILFLFNPEIVLAGKYDDYFYAAEKIPNVYVNKVKNGENHYKQGRFMRSKTDNTIAYCIEPFEILSETLKYKSYDTDQEKYLGISKEKWNKISLIAYYEYGYENHTTEEWYYITQMMIWQVMDTKSEFYFTDKLNGNKTNIYDSKIEEINNLVERHSILPSFANKSYTYSIGKEIVLNDANKVLDGYTIDSEKTTLVEKNSNRLVIYSDSKIGTEVTFTKKFKKYNRPTVAFIDSKAQNIITPGNPESISFQLNLKIEAGKIKINKLDFDTEEKRPSGSGILIGTEYTIYNSNNEIVDILTIDENYESFSMDLPFDIYTIKETKTMPGYRLDTDIYLVEIDEFNLNHELTLKNKPIKSKVEIYKYYSDKLEEGIMFEIYDSNYNLIDTVITNEYGKIEKELYYGKYIFHQLNTTKNYLKVEDFEIVIDENSESVIKIELYDEKFSSKLIIYKVDSETSNIINDEVIFNIYDVDKDEYIQIDNNIDLKAKNGILTIDKIFAGKYIINEKTSPKGYKTTNKKIEFIIDEDNEFKYDENNYPIYEIMIENDKEIIEIEVPNTNLEYNLEIQLFFEDKRKLSHKYKIKKKLTDLFC